MKANAQWSRRAFLQSAGYTSALGILSGVAPWGKASVEYPRTGITTPRFAYVASSAKGINGANETAASGIHVFDVRKERWQWKQSIVSRSPASLALHPGQRFLYAVNEVDEYEGLPRGTVEAYMIESDGRLTLINRQPLSLSGTRPRHVAISPDGNYLVVAIHAGGAYNVLPIAPDGMIGRVTGIFKEVGAGLRPDHQASAHPHTAAFSSTGQYLLATDLGCDRVSVFTVQNGRILRTHLVMSRPASGPGHLAVGPTGEFLYVSNTLDGSIACYRMHTGGILELQHEVRAADTSPACTHEAEYRSALAISPSGRFLYSGALDKGICVWKIDLATGKLSLVQRWSEDDRSLHMLIPSPDGRFLFAADHGQGEVLSLGIDADSGKLGTALTLAKTATPASLALKYL